MDAHFVTKTTDFIATLPLGLTLTASLQHQTIHTVQSPSGAFWNGLVLSAIANLSLTSFLSEAQPGHWEVHPSRTRHRNSLAKQQNLAKSQDIFFLTDIKIVQAFMCFLKRQKAAQTLPA